MQSRALPDGSMAIHAINFHGGSRLPINLSGAVTVLREMAIHALHSLFEVDVRQVHGLLKLLRIFKCNGLPFLIQPVALAVVIVNAAEHPTMPVKIRKLRSLQLRFNSRRAGVL